MRYLVFIIALFAALQTNAQNNIVYGAGINYTNGAPTFTPPVRTSRVAIDTVTGRWYHFNTPGGWQLIGNTIEEIAGCTAPAYTPGKGDSKVVINNCSPQPELYFWNGSAWVLVGGGSVYAGEGIRIENDTIILDSLYVLRFRTGDTTDLNAGAVSWNAAEQTLDVVINQGAVTGQMFQEVLYFTKNQTGAQIDDGTVVMAAGTTGNSGKILIAPAIADGSVNSEYILGLATQNLPNGGEGMVTHFGKVRGIQTDGANYGETWVDGDVLYCSSATPGYLTKVLPTAPNLKIPIAIVIHAHPSNGTLFVRPSHFPDLAQINDVELSSPTNGQVLTYNSTLSRWENATPANQLQTLSTDGSAGNISISSGNTITLNVNDADASATNELQMLSTGTNTLTLSNGGGTVTVDTNPADDVTGNGTSGQVSYWSGTQTQTGSSSLLYNDVQKSLTLTNSTQSGTPRGWLMQQTTADGAGNLFIMQKSRGGAITSGTTIGVWDAEGFDGAAYQKASRITFTTSGTISAGIVPGTISFVTANTSGTLTTRTTLDHLGVFTHLGSAAIGASFTPAANLHVRGSGTSSSTWTAQFHNSGGANNALMVRDDGNVGIGTSTMTGRVNFTDNGSFGLYGTGTSPNYLAGSLGIGITAPRTALEVNTDQIISTSNVWTSRTSAADNQWFGITYGNGLFVAVASSGVGNRIMTSPDGINWTSRTSPADNDWTSVCYGNGLFVAVAATGVNNRVMTSSDGINWTLRSNPIDNTWRSVTYGNGLFVAVSDSGTGNRVMTSPDGINWTIRASAADNVWRSVAYGNGIFVAVSNTGTGNRVMTSYDGITWTIRASAADNLWYGVTCGNGLFVAVASNSVMTSPDGINWTLRTAANNNFWYSVCYGNGMFVATSISGTLNRIMTSIDGITWVLKTTPNSNSYIAICYGNDMFVAVAASGTGNRVMSSGKILEIEPANNNIYQGNTRFTGQTIIGTTTQNASAAFEVASTTQGVLFPRMTTTERNAIATPADGLVIYNTTDNKLQVRAGGAWIDLH